MNQHPEPHIGPPCPSSAHLLVFVPVPRSAFRVPRSALLPLAPLSSPSTVLTQAFPRTSQKPPPKEPVHFGLETVKNGHETCKIRPETVKKAPQLVTISPQETNPACSHKPQRMQP